MTKRVIYIGGTLQTYGEFCKRYNVSPYDIEWLPVFDTPKQWLGYNDCWYVFDVSGGAELSAQLVYEFMDYAEAHNLKSFDPEHYNKTKRSKFKVGDKVVTTRVIKDDDPPVGTVGVVDYVSDGDKDACCVAFGGIERGMLYDQLELVETTYRNHQSDKPWKVGDFVTAVVEHIVNGDVKLRPDKTYEILEVIDDYLIVVLDEQGTERKYLTRWFRKATDSEIAQAQLKKEHQEHRTPFELARLKVYEHLSRGYDERNTPFGTLYPRKPLNQTGDEVTEENKMTAYMYIAFQSRKNVRFTNENGDTYTKNVTKLLTETPQVITAKSAYEAELEATIKVRSHFADIPTDELVVVVREF